jgi:hypothetical protein
MTNEQIAATVLGVAALFWPKLMHLAKGLLPAWLVPAPGTNPPALGTTAPIPASTTVSYEAAIHNLALVRTRLVFTTLLDEPTKKAIDTLTLQLVAGSDK